MTPSYLEYIGFTGDDTVYDGVEGFRPYVFTLKGEGAGTELSAEKEPTGRALAKLYRIATDEFAKEGYTIQFMRLDRSAGAETKTELGIIVSGGNDETDRKKRNEALIRINARAKKHIKVLNSDS